MKPIDNEETNSFNYLFIYYNVGSLSKEDSFGLASSQLSLWAIEPITSFNC